jgi:signal transduction histidine kinase
LLPRIFERLAPGPAPTTQEPGLDPGLALVRELVTLHGGTIVAESPGPGLGSTFTVELPLRAADRPAAV